jgi:hypothetical protein
MQLLTRSLPVSKGLRSSGLEPQVPASPVFNNDLRTALRHAVRRHEIGEDTPYKLSFAEKGRSGASFGFMQGDLGQNQPEVKAAFRRALVAHNVAEEKISSLMQSLSAPVARNPLSEADTKLVNNALDAPKGHLLVDAMDEQAARQVRRRGKCVR